MCDTFSTCARHGLHHLLSHLPDIKGVLILAVWLPALLAGCDGNNVAKDSVPRAVRYTTVPSPSATAAGVWIGEIRAHDETTLGFQLEGRILSRQVEIGDNVTKGQLLATLDSDINRNQLNSAQAEVESARAAEQVAAANLRRMQALMPSGAIARVELDNATANWQAAQSRRKSAQATLNNAQENLSWTQLTAPRAGVITAVNASAGQVVSAGQAVFTLAAGQERDAVFDVTDPQAMAGQGESRLNVSLLSTPALTTPGILRDISPQADPQTRTWRVRVRLETPPVAMTLGATVRAQMPRAAPAMMTLPASALTRADEQAAVFIVTPQNQLQLRPIALGGYSIASIFVTAGIEPGENVVTAGVSKLRAGETVVLGEKQQ
ncbi:efflux RND transporter periplasmic adaptor subunit [Candidatus Symbiopectobacterium sp. NZEC151]|uniref:efflux RND transporter periplasmic adaptor subunit n=2 Tax=unclassified Symbiopectobacterium TaxID=2794573 RepID=UPI00222762C6|nr:efflux RND transporter periplasmic adaptor subunit [Candidatus Symbiopectobacterium sp. NZEC151]MCW2473968.1 efflux RND transporter periplasmic adaptor subunit [Candidatus Symbiopectobacterium sp. NZEC151]